MQLIALQLATEWENRPANQARVRKLLASAAISPGTLVVLCEMFDSGFSMNAAATDPGEISESEIFCSELAKANQITLVAGLVARAADKKLANEAVIFAPDGHVITRYRKLQPFSPVGEEQHYVAGDAVQVADWQGMAMSPFICYDLRFPEHFRAASACGAELLLVLANWPAVRSGHWTTLLKARAIENQAYVLGVNRCGSDPHASYDGQTCLFDPLGNEVFHADAREQILTAEIHTDVVRQCRAAFPALRDRRV